MSKHDVVHVEIPAQDPKQAGQFYADLFGWNVETDDTFDYTMFQAEKGPGGGFTQVGDQTKPGDVLLYVDCDDVEAALARVEELGGSIVQTKTEIPGMGWYGVFTDPTGNRMAVWKSAHS